jgi:D-glycero-alpha-D-manno-heptose-7-phosphate kinase
MIIRSKAPLRLGLAGGGSDVSPYSDLYGGLVLNATINLYAYCTIEETNNGKIEIIASDLEQHLIYDSTQSLPINGILDLHKGVYNRLLKEFHLGEMSFRIITCSDAPAGSGLGSSSTMVVCMLKAFVEWLNLPLGDYEIARLAYEIERKDLNLSGGKQDQYAATFGGFNFMEFSTNDVVIVNPLRIKRWIVDELESSLILYYTGASRSSAVIIDEQKKNTSSGNSAAIEAMHRIKQHAVEMKAALLKGDMVTFTHILGSGWENKKKMASAVTNPLIQEVFDVAMAAGAVCGKVSGAGGGGFIIFVVEPTGKMQVTRALHTLEGRVIGFQFSEGGTHGWKIYDK